MKRTKHSLSHYKLFSCDMAELIPVACYEVLPGDAVQQHTSLLIRVSPLLAPVMHPVSIRVHHWYVPYRLLWSNWEDFITGGPDGLNASVVPTISSGGGGFSAGALADYLGIPPSVANLAVSALPFRAYSMIWNEYYRDEDLNTERAVALTDGNDATTPVTLAKVCWEKDYFTSARPWPRKGSAVTLPLGTSAPINYNWANTTPNKWRKASDGTVLTTVQPNIQNEGATGYVRESAGGVTLQLDPTGNMVADLSSATSVDVDTVRRAFALQRYKEARAIYGSRYTEYLRYLGVRSSDARLQRPEYLGGGKQTIAFTEVLQTGQDFDANAGVGRLRGHGIAAMRSRRYRRFFEEHGVVMSLMSVRPRTMYNNGVHRSFSRTTKEDYWQKELEHIGQQTVLNKEVYAAHGTPGGTFGYQHRYSEYHHLPSEVAGEMRTTTLNFWHLGRIFASAPALNSSFVECDPSKRVHAVQTNDVLWVMASHSIQARRMVSRTGIGRIL